MSAKLLAGPDISRPAMSSQCADRAYDAPSEGSLPAAVGVEPEPGQFPVPVFGVVGQDLPRGVTSVSGPSAGSAQRRRAGAATWDVRVGPGGKGLDTGSAASRAGLSRVTRPIVDVLPA